MATASHLPGRGVREGGRRPLRHPPRQFGWRGHPAEERRYPSGADQAVGRLPGRRAPAGQDPASDPRVDSPARVWDRLWYADCNDAARLADDAIHKLLVERDPIAGPALASQPRSDERRGETFCKEDGGEG